MDDRTPSTKSFFHKHKGPTRPHFEWNISPDEAEWRRLSQSDLLTNAPQPANHRARARLLLAIGAVLLVVAGIGGWLWHRAQTGLAITQNELGAVVEADVWAAVHDQEELGVSALNAEHGPRIEAIQGNQAQQAFKNSRQGDNPLMTDVQILHLDGDIAVVEAIIQLAADGPTYRQVRVYRYGINGWMHTDLTAHYWEPRQLETTHFIFHFTTLDADRLVKIATRMDTLYATFYSSFFPHEASKEKLAVYIELVPASSQRFAEAARDEPYIAVESPALYLTPVSMSGEDALALVLVMALLDNLVFQANAYQSMSIDDVSRQPLLDGVRLWHLWASNLRLAAWRKPMVQWVYNHDGAIKFEKSQFGPDPCSLSRLWLSSPLEPENILLCDGQIRVEDSTPWRGYPPPTKLDDIVLPAASNGNPRLHPTASVTLATLIEYAAATYGRERIPILLAGYRWHERWETLIPAVFGVSASEFERGWHDYLDKQYAVDLASS